MGNIYRKKKLSFFVHFSHRANLCERWKVLSIAKGVYNSEQA
jgi:hypothetical protein